MANDQRGTSFKQNMLDLWKAIKARSRIGHEIKNVIRELIREYSGTASVIILALIVLLLLCQCTK